MKKLEIKLKHFEELEAIVDQERLAVSVLPYPCYVTMTTTTAGDAEAAVVK